MSKYNAQRTPLDGYTFASKAEAARYAELVLLERAGHISELKVHPRFKNLIPRQPGEKTGISYSADFKYREGGKVVVEDVKSEATAKRGDYVMRRKLFKWRYPDIIFREVIR